MRPVPVRPDEVDGWVPLIKWHLQSCCRGGDITPEQLVKEVKATERQMWLVVDEAVLCLLLTNISNDDLKTCRVTHCAGKNFKAWLPLFSLVENWARDLGCKRIEAITRPGWERPLQQFELKKTHVVLEKRL